MFKFTNYVLIAFFNVLLVSGLAGCGGNSESDSSNNQPQKVSYDSVVSFGDSLSDAGAYKVGIINNTLEGGLFTVNGINEAPGSDPVPSYTWAQLVSAATVGKVSCAARTGGFGVAITNMTDCTNFAQGGARITNASGIGRIPFGLGALTEPIVTQVTNYLNRTSTGRFSGNELITVQGGANEIFVIDDIDRLIANQGTKGSDNAIASMVKSATELSAIVKDMISKGAKHVVVTNLPDISLTPFAFKTNNDTRTLLLAMTKAFNQKLKEDLAGVGNVLYIDVFTENQKQMANPGQFGLSNVKDTACNMNFIINPLVLVNKQGSSLACNRGTMIAGDTSRYLFADTVHPTPYGHKLISQLVIKELVLAGWM